MLMLALQSYEQASGFSVLTEDELYYVNGGSFSFLQPILETNLPNINLPTSQVKNRQNHK